MHSGSFLYCVFWERDVRAYITEDEKENRKRGGGGLPSSVSEFKSVKVEGIVLPISQLGGNQLIFLKKQS